MSMNDDNPLFHRIVAVRAATTRLRAYHHTTGTPEPTPHLMCTCTEDSRWFPCPITEHQTPTHR